MAPKSNKKKSSPVRASDKSAQSAQAVSGSVYDLPTLSRIVDQLQESILEVKQMISDMSSENQEGNNILKQSAKNHNEGRPESKNIEAKLNLRLKIHEHRCKRVLNNVRLENQDERNKFFQFLNEEDEPNPAFDFKGRVRPRVFITPKKAVILTFPSPLEAQDFETRLIAVLKDPATRSRNSLDDISRIKINAKGEQQNSLYISPSFPKAFFPVVARMTELGRNMKKSSIISSYNVYLGETRPCLKVLGVDKTSEKKGKRWFETKETAPNVTHFPKLDLSANDREWTTSEYEDTQEDNQENVSVEGSGAKTKRKKSDSSTEKTPKKRITLKIGGEIVEELNLTEDHEANPQTSTPKDNKKKESDKEN